ncbi:helix-turn-helix transcriptional regulator [Streptomyces parvus]|uniref:helix-turn-helix transcriptional regulator n=1 Tax=Streptomyces parvus TaxID=66428 RepID=UPI0033D8244B
MPQDIPQADRREPVPMPGPDSTFAERLNYLFDRFRPPAGDSEKSNPKTGEFRHSYVAKTILGYEKGSITPTYVTQLRQGERPNPGIDTARLLARFFGVPAAFLVEEEDTAKIMAQFALVEALRERGVKKAAMRMQGLSPASTAQILGMIDLARTAEGLPPEPEPLP